jgi:hypothetical protein
MEPIDERRAVSSHFFVAQAPNNRLRQDCFDKKALLEDQALAFLRTQRLEYRRRLTSGSS